MLTVVGILLSFAPGAILGFAIPPGRDRWIVWSASPILTLGLVGFGLSWLSRIGVPDGALWILVAEFAVALVAVAGSWLVARRRAAPAPGAGPPKASTTTAVPADRATMPADAKVPAPAATVGGDRPAVSEGRQSEGADPGEGLDEWPPSTADPQAVAPPEVAAESVGARGAWRKWFGWGNGRPKVIEVIAVGVPSVLAVLFGQLILKPLDYPPGWDALNHGVLTQNIIKSGSTAISSVCTTGSSVPALSCHFYPLGIDVQWAQMSLLTGDHVSRAMLAWSESVGPLALVIAVYAAVRAFGGRPVVAGCAGLVPVLASPMFPSLLTGRPPEAFAPGLSVAVALLAALALRGTQPVRFGLLAGLGTAGLIMSHTYEVLFAATLTIAFLFVRPLSFSLRKILAAASALVLAMLISVGPAASGLIGAGGERAASQPAFVGQFGAAWSYWVTSLKGYALWGPSPYRPGQPLTVAPIHTGLVITMVCLFASPLCLVFKQVRWARPWLYTWVVWTAIGLWTSTSDSHASLLVSSLWYGIPARLRTMVLPLHGVLVVAGAYAIGLAVHWLLTTLVRRGRDVRIGAISAATVAALVVVSLSGLAATPTARASLAADLESRSAHGRSYPQVFRWLASHTSPGKVVAYDRHVQFMTWSYADDGVPLLFGIPPLPVENKSNYDDRWLAWHWLVNTADAAPAGCLVRKYGIEYVVVGAERMPGYKLDYSPKRLVASRNLTLIHRDDGITVYRVNDTGSACSTG